jgi:hypothetical protein
MRIPITQPSGRIILRHPGTSQEFMNNLGWDCFIILNRVLYNLIGLTFIQITSLKRLGVILKNHRMKLSFFFSLLVVLCSVFTGPRTFAAESENIFSRDLASLFHLQVDREPGETEKATPSNSERILPGLLPSSPHTQVPLSDRLKLFYNSQPIRGDYYEQRDKSKKCAVFGIDVSF